MLNHGPAASRLQSVTVALSIDAEITHATQTQKIGLEILLLAISYFLFSPRLCVCVSVERVRVVGYFRGSCYCFKG